MVIRLNKDRKKCMLFGLLSSAISWFVMFNTDSNSGYGLYFIIPILFGLLSFFFPILNFSNVNDIPSLILSYTMFVKYAISPLVSCCGGYHSWLGIYPGSEAIRTSILWTISELVFIYFACILGHKKYKPANKYEKINASGLEHTLVLKMVIVAGMVSLVLFPSSFKDMRFIWDLTNLTDNIVVDEAGSGIWKTLFIFARYSLIFLLVNYFYERDQRKKSAWNLIGAFSPFVLNCLYNSNLSRMSIASNIIIGLGLIGQLFSENKSLKKVIKITVVIGLILVAFLSFQKFFGEGRGDVANSSSVEWWGDTLNMYFTGIKETAVGVNALSTIQSKFGINRIPLFFNDVFSNVSFLSHFTNKERATLMIYNYQYFGQTKILCQIPPNICEGVYYFGFLGGIWPGFFAYLSYYLSYKSKKALKIDLKFSYIYAAMWSSMILMINSCMIISFIVNISLLYMVVVYLNKKFVFKKS